MYANVWLSDDSTELLRICPLLFCLLLPHCFFRSNIFWHVLKERRETLKKVLQLTPTIKILALTLSVESSKRSLFTLCIWHHLNSKNITFSSARPGQAGACLPWQIVTPKSCHFGHILREKNALSGAREEREIVHKMHSGIFVNYFKWPHLNFPRYFSIKSSFNSVFLEKNPVF